MGRSPTTIRPGNTSHSFSVTSQAMTSSSSSLTFRASQPLIMATSTAAHIAGHFHRPQLICQKSIKPITSHHLPYIKTYKVRSRIIARKRSTPVNASLVEKEQQQQQSESNSKSTNVEVDMKKKVQFLYDDLPHLFDDQGIDRTAYDEFVKFRDPITKHDTIDGYLFNIALLKYIFKPDFQLHWAKQTGPYEITTRWTMVMTFVLLPWKPELVFTGTSVMAVNPKTGKFCSHLDYWDSIENNEYFSVEGLVDVFKQLRYYRTPDLETPKYQILKRTANYEVRKYAPYIVVETAGDKLSGSRGFNNVAGFIFGKNSKQEKIAMTTPVFTQKVDNGTPKVSIQIVLPSDKDMNSLPAPVEDDITLKTIEGGIAAAVKFSGKATEDIVSEKASILRSNLLNDGLVPKPGCSFARYNDPGRTWSFTMRNEVLIWLENFSID